VDADTGDPAWAVRYPRQAEESERLTDLTPCVYADGRLYAAPADSTHLLCLDAASGQTLWEREAVEVVHLLGVGHGRVIFTTPKGIRAVGATDGSDRSGWMQPQAGDGMRPIGRGLLIGDLVLWPNEQGVIALGQEDGEVAGDRTLLHRLPAGNLAYAHGCLAVADQYALSLFVPSAMRLEEKQRQARNNPQSPEALLALARAEAAAGRAAAAVKTFTRAETEAGALDPPRAERLRREAHDGRRLALLEAGRRDVQASRFDDAAASLAEAAALNGPAAERVQVLVRTAECWRQAEEYTRAVAAWEAILAAPELRTLLVLAGSGRPVRAGDHAAAALRALPASAREESEKRAQALWAAATPAQRFAAAERLAAVFPHTRTARQALAYLARDREQMKQPSPATHAWRLLLAAGVEGEEEAEARAGLARCYEQLPSHATPPGDGAALPLRKRWHASLQPGEAVLPGAEPGTDSLVFSGDAAGELIARRLATGEVAWRARLPFIPAWAGIYGNVVIAGGKRGTACLREEDGGFVWEFPAQPPEPLQGFQLQAGRLFFFQGWRRLFALDVETGRILWSCWAPDGRLQLPPPRGRFFSASHASSTRLLVQTATGRRWLLDAATGRLLDDSPTSSQPWPAPPRVLDANTLALVADSRRVLTLDASTGKECWHIDLPGATTRTGEPPQILNRGDVLLLVTPTNLGYRLDRLDRTSGKLSWPRPCLLNLDRLDTTTWTLGDDSVAFAHDHFVEAHSLADGRLLWERPLPEAASWTVRRVGDGLLAYPDVAARPYFRFQSLGLSVQWKRVEPLDAPAGFPVLGFDARTGRLVQRLNFPGFPRAQLRPDSLGSLVVCASLASGSGAHLLTVGLRGGVVALAGEVWGLAPDQP
jgi:tetratricopeptide (TPR) repeat protein